jgi:hypothetical protein
MAGTAIATPMRMRFRRSVWAGGLLFAAIVSSGCPGDDTEAPRSGMVKDAGVDAPADTNADSVLPLDQALDDRSVPLVMDGPADGLTCPAGLKPYYRDPGCGGEAVAVCAASDDGCFGQEICLCDGRNSRRCSWSDSPYRHVGPCTYPDARIDSAEDGPNACNCPLGRTCLTGSLYVGDDCSMCECRAEYGEACSAGGCPSNDAGEVLPPARCESNPGTCGTGDCVFDQGCESPRAYCGNRKCDNSFTYRTFCGCDGQSYYDACPRKPYRYMGPCG